MLWKAHPSHHPHGPSQDAKLSSRTTSRRSANFKWRWTPLAEDILISSVRGGGAELGRCEARNDADATDAKFKGVCILRRFSVTCPKCITIRILRRCCGTFPHPHGFLLSTQCGFSQSLIAFFPRDRIHVNAVVWKEFYLNIRACSGCSDKIPFKGLRPWIHPVFWSISFFLLPHPHGKPKV